MERLKRKILRTQARLAWWQKQREALMPVAAKHRAQRPDALAAPLFGILAQVAQRVVEDREDELDDLEWEKKQRETEMRAAEDDAF